MPHASPAYSDELVARAAKIRLVGFDVDGTLTDGRLWFDEDGRESKAFQVLDGQGLVQLRKAGVAVAFVTARNSTVAANRARELGAEPHVDCKDKVACLGAIAARMGLTMDEVAFMGDDLPDLEVLRGVGFAVAPANVHHWLRGEVHWVTPSRGGEGAARELCDLILHAQGRVEALLAGGRR
ncbi:KdsC family phosphatase [Luteimonas saliphila]|uniref:KdsC family phosphatase n=1 Tax=Luteimonas saliphila TaxID=2804919 RepID=UPI003080B0B1